MYIEWLDVPPSFPGSATRGAHPTFSSHIAVKVFMNDLKVPPRMPQCKSVTVRLPQRTIVTLSHQDLNRCNDMRCYFDEGDMTNCILKASPHLIFHAFAKVGSASAHAFLLQAFERFIFVAERGC